MTTCGGRIALFMQYGGRKGKGLRLSPVTVAFLITKENPRKARTCVLFGLGRKGGEKELLGANALFSIYDITTVVVRWDYER